MSSPVSTAARESQQNATTLDARLSALQQKLSDSGHRATPQRLHILRTLLATDAHPTAEAIWDEVRLVSPTTTLATVYKTLHTLIDMGEVLELDTKDSKRHYDALQPTPHPHAVCKRCGRIDDIDGAMLPDLQSPAAAASGYRLDEQHVTFYGLCPDCRNQPA